MRKRLYKGHDRKLFGVCGGLAEYFDLDPTIIRVGFAVAFFAFGTGLLLYLVLAVALPNPPSALP